MKFLCPRHRDLFSSLSLGEKNDLWLLWMEHAITFSEAPDPDPDKMIAVTGSAFDLACLARIHHPDSMQVELTLAAILVCRALRDKGESSAADRVLFRALDSLQSTESWGGSPSGQCSTDECLEVLLDTRRQPGFFAEYLNWPSFPFTTPVAGSALAVH
ncbi:hypothetical protein KUV44_14345 [Marinobacter daepoensis]|uniref:Uncharacterized protein n=1 Tax=Marinobacter daepoensis TaxID=262077 RepID=A0ABS3BDN2_9GAMM|nr:hypothetical protein [Marinobacter daepoensis]MBN7769938.1 hypothetical protein [Marinobacter daepoensis]MBY6032637.1 hypothetical protein [Marinobacter daepoensis]MBY6080326.1 hypothetical protein [Marinobacter daepoensis]